MGHLLNNRELQELLSRAKGTNLKDNEGADDYAFLEETVFPTLLPALVHLLEHVEEADLPPMPSKEGGEGTFNPIRWLAEHLVRFHPDGGVFKHESAYADHLLKVAAQRKEQRLQKEAIIKEQKRKEEEERVRQEKEKTDKEKKEKKEREEAKKAEIERKLREKNAKGELAAKAAAGPALADQLLEFRGTCMKILEQYDFLHSEDTKEAYSLMYKEACRTLTTHSAASFSAVADLLDSDTLYYHTASDKKEFVIEDEEDEEDEEDTGVPVQKKEPPPPEITVRDLPPINDDVSYVLKREKGVTFEPVVDERQAMFIADCKYTEGMFFFEEKRPGTYIAVPLIRADKVVGIMVGDTLDSVSGAELQESEKEWYQCVAVVLAELLDKADWCLMDAKRSVHTAKLKEMAADPATLPDQIAHAMVDAIDNVFPGATVSLGTIDTEINMRLVVTSLKDGTRQPEKTVTGEDVGEHVSLMFQAKSQCEVQTVKDEAEEVPKLISMAVPIISGAQKAVSAVLYVGTERNFHVPINEDIEEFMNDMAQIAQPILLPPSENAMRVLRILAESSIGDANILYQAAADLCKRHTAAEEVYVAMQHGPDAVRSVYSMGAEVGKVFSFKDKPAIATAMQDLITTLREGVVAVPLTRNEAGKKVPFGVIALKNAKLESEQQHAFEGVAAALSSALEVSEFRRKMVVGGLTALESLLKRAPSLKGLYFAFIDIGGKQVCAKMLGEPIEGMEPGKVITSDVKLQTAAVQPMEEGPILGLIGCKLEILRASSAPMYEESPWDIVSDVAKTLAQVANVLSQEGMLLDRTSSLLTEREEMLVSHFNACRFELVTKKTTDTVGLKYIDAAKSNARPFPMVVQIMQAIMYILGHQQRDVSEWLKCRKLITHHLFVEMKMIDIRGQLKVHKLKLAKACIDGLTAGDISLEVGPQALALWQWVLMVLDVQGL